MHYDLLGDPIVRTHDIPRMTELSVARKPGDRTVPRELKRYPARSAIGKKRQLSSFPSK